MEAGWEAAASDGSDDEATCEDASSPSPAPASSELGARLPPLPTEVLYQIFAELTPSKGTNSRARPPTDLVHCCRASKRFHQVATPVLLRHLVLTLPDVDGGQSDPFGLRLARQQEPYDWLGGDDFGSDGGRSDEPLDDSEDENEDGDPKRKDMDRRAAPDRIYQLFDLLGHHPDLRLHPRTINISLSARHSEPWYGAAPQVDPLAVHSVKELLLSLPSLQTVEVNAYQLWTLVGSVAHSLPQSLSRATIRSVKLEATSLSGERPSALICALSSLHGLREVDLAFVKSDWLSLPPHLHDSATFPFPAQLSHLSLKQCALHSLLDASTNSTTSLRTLHLDLTHGWRLPPSFFLGAFHNLEELKITYLGPEELSKLLPSLPLLNTLHHLTLGGVPYQRLLQVHLGARLPPALQELDLHLCLHPSDLIEILEDSRFDRCAIHWHKYLQPDLREADSEDVEEAVDERVRRQNMVARGLRVIGWRASLPATEAVTVTG